MKIHVEKIKTDAPSPQLFAFPAASASKEPVTPPPPAPQPQVEPRLETSKGSHTPSSDLSPFVLERYHRGEITWLRALATVRPLSASYSIRDLMLSD